MAHKIPVITKKIWNIIFFMLKKGISKTKLLLDLNKMMKSGKITSGEYEFSCRYTPRYPLSLFSTHSKHQNNPHHLANYNPPLTVDDCDDITIDPAVIKVLNKSPMVEPLKITDSPFRVAHGFEDGEVDEAADRFIRRLYDNMRVEMAN